MVGEIAGDVHWAGQLRLEHAGAHLRASLDNLSKDLLRRLVRLGEFALVHDTPNTGPSGTDGDDPEPFVVQSHYHGVPARRAFVQRHSFEVPKDSQFFKMRMNHAQLLEVSC